MVIKLSKMSGGAVSGGTSAERPTTPMVGEQFINGTLGIAEVYTETNGWQPLTSSSTGIPFGDNSTRPSTPAIGQPHFNGEESRLELYTISTGWQNIVQETPSVINISGAYKESTTSSTITINGINFSVGAIAYATGSDGINVQAETTSLVSVVEVTAVFSGLSKLYEPYDIKVVNPSNLYGVLYSTLFVDRTPVWITGSGTLGTYLENVSMSVQTSATDYESKPLYFSITSGNLPAGLSLNQTTGVISGIPNDIISNTTYSFTLDAFDGENHSYRDFSITINDRGPTWTTSNTLQTFTKNISYSTTLNAVDDNQGSVSYSLVSGSIPSGLSLNQSTGEISGIPTSAQSVVFTIRATDEGYTDKQFSLPNSAPSWSTSGQLSAANYGTSYAYQINATDDGATSYVISSGSLPPGLQISSSGLISGSTTTVGSYSFTIDATDINGSVTTSGTFSIQAVGITTEVVRRPSGSNSWGYGGNNTDAISMQFSSNVKVEALSIFGSNSSSWTVSGTAYVAIWSGTSAGGSIPLAQQSISGTTIVAGSPSVKLSFASPAILSANTWYTFGIVWVSSQTGSTYQGGAGANSGSISYNGANITWTAKTSDFSGSGGTLTTNGTSTDNGQIPRIYLSSPL